jgi:hypothetical protein
MTTVELTNTNPFHQLRIFHQNRARNLFTATDSATTPAPKRSTRAELEGKGRAITMKPTRVTTRFSSEMRDCPVPLYQSLGYSSVEEYCTTIMDKELIASQQAITPAPSVQRVLDSWEKPAPFASVAPQAKTYLQMDEARRFLIECDSECVLQIANVSTVRTLKLKNRDKATGQETQVAYVAPTRAFSQSAITISGSGGASVADYSQAKVLIVNGQAQGCIELLPS